MSVKKGEKYKKNQGEIDPKSDKNLIKNNTKKYADPVS